MCMKSMFESIVVPANMLAGNNELLSILPLILVDGSLFLAECWWELCHALYI